MKKSRLLLTAMLLLGGCDCSDDSTPDDDGGPDASGADAAVADSSVDAGVSGDGGVDSGIIVVSDSGVTVTPDGGDPFTCFQVSCGTRTSECGDCIDNDDDGLFDSQDPECLGPCDNTEGPVLLAGVGGETGGPCKSDCYFDFGNGSGGGDCQWDSRCDPLAVAPDYPPEGMACEYEPSRVGTRDCPATQPATCLDNCGPLTPNGCDCFGCCTFDAIRARAPASGGEYVWIGSVADGTNTGTCTLADVTDTSKCRPCTPVAECLNGCGVCELCVGRDTLPPECLDGGVPDAGMGDAAVPDGGVARCNTGVQPCGLPTDAPCPQNSFCITGCCITLL